MRITEILTESKSADLYHSTSEENLQSILDDDRFNAGYDTHAEGQVSFTRDFKVAMRFATSIASGEPAAIAVIDQLKLSQQVGKKQKPVDAFNWVPEGTADADEQEEGVFAEYVKNANKLIKRIYVFAKSPEEVTLTDPRVVFVPYEYGQFPDPFDKIPSERVLQRYLQKNA